MDCTKHLGEAVNKLLDSALGEEICSVAINDARYAPRGCDLKTAIRVTATFDVYVDNPDGHGRKSHKWVEE